MCARQPSGLDPDAGPHRSKPSRKGPPRPARRKAGSDVHDTEHAIHRIRGSQTKSVCSRPTRPVIRGHRTSWPVMHRRIDMEETDLPHGMSEIDDPVGDTREDGSGQSFTATHKARPRVRRPLHARSVRPAVTASPAWQALKPFGLPSCDA